MASSYEHTNRLFKSFSCLPSFFPSIDIYDGFFFTWNDEHLFFFIFLLYDFFLLNTVSSRSLSSVDMGFAGMMSYD